MKSSVSRFELFLIGVPEAQKIIAMIVVAGTTGRKIRGCQHSSFHLVDHITDDTVWQFTTGSRQENKRLGYPKEIIPAKEI